jgi:hypothetical protein
MTRQFVRMALLAVLPFVASAAAAQDATGHTPADGAGRPWIVIGGASTTVLGDCPECSTEGNYRHAGGFLADAGVSLNSRTDLGGELLFVPSTAVTGDDIHTTFVMAVVQFRFWKTSGFFVKAGSGMAFVRNWVVDLSGGTDPAPPFTSKAFALGLGAGWEWRVSPRLGVQVFGAQHVATLGDLETSQARFENVVGNFWSFGGAIVFR